MIIINDIIVYILYMYYVYKWYVFFLRFNRLLIKPKLIVCALIWIWMLIFRMKNRNSNKRFMCCKNINNYHLYIHMKYQYNVFWTNTLFRNRSMTCSLNFPCTRFISITLLIRNRNIKYENIPSHPISHPIPSQYQSEFHTSNEPNVY